MWVYIADALALLHVLDNHIFEQNGLSGAGLADEVKMPSPVVVFHIYQRLVASVKIFLPSKIPSWGRLSGGGASLALTYLS